MTSATVKRGIHTAGALFSGAGKFGEEIVEISYWSSYVVVTIQVDLLEVICGQLGEDLCNILLKLLSMRGEGVEHELGIGAGDTGDEVGIAMVHRECNEAMAHVDLGIFEDVVLRQVVSGVAEAEKVRIEADDEGAGGRSKSRESGLNVPKFGLKL